MIVSFTSIGQMADQHYQEFVPSLAPTLDNADPLFGADRSLVITPDFYLHHVEVADQDIASGSI